MRVHALSAGDYLLNHSTRVDCMATTVHSCTHDDAETSVRCEILFSQGSAATRLSIRYDTIRSIYVRSKADDIWRASALHRNEKIRKTKNKNRLAQKKRCGKSPWRQSGIWYGIVNDVFVTNQILNLRVHERVVKLQACVYMHVQTQWRQLGVFCVNLWVAWT